MEEEEINKLKSSFMSFERVCKGTSVNDTTHNKSALSNVVSIFA